MSSRAISRVDRADIELDTNTTARVVESLVIRGDISALSPEERSRFYVQMCEALGLNPASNPFAILRLNGKEILYPTRGASDQLAAIHKLNRRIIDGPKVIDLHGTKLVYAVCEATHPNGRVETAVATVPLSDPSNVLMKCETKAKRRATLSILGLGMLDETEVEAIPASAKQVVPQIEVVTDDVARARGNASAPARQHVAPQPTPLPEEEEEAIEEEPRALAQFRVDVMDRLNGEHAMLTYEEAAGIWLDNKRDLEALGPETVVRAWGELCTVVPEPPKPRKINAELKRACAAEQAKRDGAPPPDDKPRGGKRPAPENDVPSDESERAVLEADARDGAQAKAPDVVGDWKDHIATKRNAHELANSWRKHRAEWGPHYEACTEATLDTLMVLLASSSRMACMTFLSNQSRKRAA